MRHAQHSVPRPRCWRHKWQVSTQGDHCDQHLTSSRAQIAFAVVMHVQETVRLMRTLTQPQHSSSTDPMRQASLIHPEPRSADENGVCPSSPSLSIAHPCHPCIASALTTSTTCTGAGGKTRRFSMSMATIGTSTLGWAGSERVCKRMVQQGGRRGVERWPEPNG